MNPGPNSGSGASARKVAVRLDQVSGPGQHQLWQTDFTYLKVTGWGWYYLSTVLDDFWRFVVAWKLCTTMRAEDVTETLDPALAASGLDQVKVRHRPRLLSDNGSSTIAGDLAEWLKDKGMTYIRGAPRHPQTQAKIERWRQTLKDRFLLEHYYLPGALEEQVSAFVSTTTTAAPTRAWAPSPRPTSTTAEAGPP